MPTRILLYFASVDIHRCYDNINQERVYRIVQDLVSDEDYLVQKYSVLHPFESRRKVYRRALKKVSHPDDFQHIHTIAKSLVGKYSKAIFVDDVNVSIAKKQHILSLVKEHLLSNIVVANSRFGARFFLQKGGIPQGSILSTFLCNFYYGDIKEAIFEL